MLQEGRKTSTVSSENRKITESLLLETCERKLVPNQSVPSLGKMMDLEFVANEVLVEETIIFVEHNARRRERF